MAAFPKNKTASRASGFTLIEMLVVILIIIVLMGIVFRLAKVSTTAGAASATTARLESLKAAIEEYYAEYGMYPPVEEKDGVQPISFTYPARLPSDITSSSGDVFTWGLLSFLKNRAALVAANAEVRENASLFKSGTAWADAYNKVQTGALDPDSCTSARDRAFLNRISPFLKKAGVGSDTNRRKDNKNIWITTVYAHDAWYREWVYISKPPYQSYALFSKGADGKYDKNDPLNPEVEVNRDNIYGNIGDSK